MARCEYEELIDSLVRDQIIEKTSSDSLREKLFLKQDLSLEKVIILAQQFKQAMADSRVLRRSREGSYEQPSEVNAVSRRNTSHHPT